MEIRTQITGRGSSMPVDRGHGGVLSAMELSLLPFLLQMKMVAVVGRPQSLPVEEPIVAEDACLRSFALQP